MWQRLFRCIVEVGSRWTALAGVAFAVLGAVKEFRELTPFPAWAWWLGAISLLFLTACRIQWERQKESDRREDRSTDAKVPMNEAVRYMATKSTWIRQHHADKKHWFIELQNDLVDALVLGRVTAFARDGDRPAAKIKRPLRQIAKAEWETAEPWTFDGLFGNQTANIANKRFGDGGVFHDIQLSRDQLHSMWPRLPLWERFRYRSFLADYERLLAESVRGARA